MIGLEMMLIASMVFFAVLGMVRGFLKELGVTLPLLVMLLLMTQIEDLVGEEKVPELVGDALSFLGTTLQPETQQLILVGVYTIVIGIVMFASYHGETLAFKGSPPKGVLGWALGLLVGAVNGYLFAGTVWFYLDKYSYPLDRYPWFQSEYMTGFATDLLPFLPPALLSGLILIFLVGGLIWLRIVR
jgi:uncharacterized membrane protein required for colicin V production